jgi:hypothetical protein
MQTSALISIDKALLYIEWGDGYTPLTFKNTDYFAKMTDVSTLKLHYFPVKMNPLAHDGAAPVLSTILHDV